MVQPNYESYHIFCSISHKQKIVGGGMTLNSERLKINGGVEKEHPLLKQYVNIIISTVVSE